MWLMKVKESQQFQFFASYAIVIHANEFHPTNKAADKDTVRKFMKGQVKICFGLLKILVRNLIN